MTIIVKALHPASLCNAYAYKNHEIKIPTTQKIPSSSFTSRTIIKSAAFCNSVLRPSVCRMPKSNKIIDSSRYLAHAAIGRPRPSVRRGGSDEDAASRVSLRNDNASVSFEAVV